MSQDYFQKLLDLYFDGNLEGDELKDFESMLRSSAGNRKEFWFQARLHGRLHDHWRHQNGFRLVAPQARCRNVFMAIAALLVAICSVTIWNIGDRAGQQGRVASTDEENAVTEPAAVAMVSESLEVTWKSGVNLGPNSVVRPGLYEMTAGTLVIDFYSGARVTMKAPASFTVLSETRFRLNHGGIEVDVPEVATGFTVDIPGGGVLDLGTRFEMRVNEDGGARVEILEGEVEVWRDGIEGRKLYQERAGVEIGPDGVMSDFVVPEDQSQAAAARRFERWRELSQRISEDPSTLLYVPFLEATPGGRHLPNAGSHPNAPGLVTMVGGTWESGRWPGKYAMAFRREYDRGLAAIPGSYDQVSWMAWIKVDDLSRTYSGILLSEFEIAGEAHWQLGSEGGFRFGIRPTPQLPSRRFHRVFGEPFIQTHDPRWTCLVTTYDAKKMKVVHYVNGSEWFRNSISQAARIRFGRSTIGNSPNIALPESGNKPPDWNLRQLGGSIDEIALFSRILSPVEIMEIYSTGKPD